MDRIKNVNRFHNFIEMNSIFEVDEVNMGAYEARLFTRAQQGKTSYELGSYETKSGHAESIDFDYTYNYNEELDEITNQIITF